MPREDLITIEARVEEDSACLTLAGELIAESRTDVERILRDWIEQGIIHIIVHCSGLIRIDSAGFSTLLAALHRLRRVDGDLLLVAMNPSVRSILKVTSMEQYFRLFPTLEEGHSYLEQMAAQRKKHSLQSSKSKLSSK